MHFSRKYFPFNTPIRCWLLIRLHRIWHVFITWKFIIIVIIIINFVCKIQSAQIHIGTDTGSRSWRRRWRWGSGTRNNHPILPCFLWFALDVVHLGLFYFFVPFQIEIHFIVIKAKWIIVIAMSQAYKYDIKLIHEWHFIVTLPYRAEQLFFMHMHHAVVHTKDGRHMFPIVCEYHSPEFLACIPRVIAAVLSINVTAPSCDIDSGISILERWEAWWRNLFDLTHIYILSNHKWKINSHGES